MFCRFILVVGFDIVDVKINFLITLIDIDESIFEVVVDGLIFGEKLV